MSSVRRLLRESPWSQWRERLVAQYTPGVGAVVAFLLVVAGATFFADHLPLRDVMVCVALSLPAAFLGLVEKFSGRHPRPSGVFEPIAEMLAVGAAIVLFGSDDFFVLIPLMILNQVQREGPAVVVAAISGMLVAMVVSILCFRGLNEPALWATVGVTTIGWFALPHQIERRVRSTVEVFSSFGHEFRTPLMAIIATCDDTQRHGTLSSALQADFRIIRGNCDSMISNVNNALDLAKLRAGRFQPETQPVFLPTPITSVMASFGNRLKRDHVANVLMVGPRLRVLTLRDAMRSVLENLVSNSIKYGEGSRIDVILRTEIAHKDVYRVTLSVEDRGPGIPSEIKETMYNPFVTGTLARDAAHPSTGVGLAVVEGLTQVLSGGKHRPLHEDCSPRGARFIIQWEAPATSAIESLGTRADLGASVVVYVKDESFFARLRSVMPDGWHPERVASLDDAFVRIKTLEVHAPVILVLDQGEDLEGAARRVRKRAPNTIMVGVVQGELDANMLRVLSVTGFSAVMPRSAPVTQIEETLCAAIDIASVKHTGGWSAPKPGTFTVDENASPDPVLVVEDEPSVRRVCVRMLNRHGVACEALQDGTEAIAALTDPARRYSVALLDFNLPGANADVIVERVRASGNSLPVLVMSAAATEDRVQIRQRFKPGAVHAVLTKPINSQELMENVLRFAKPSLDVPAEDEEEEGGHSPVVGPGGLDGQTRVLAHGLYLRSMPQYVAQMRERLIVGDMDGVGSLVHRMRGAVSLVGDRMLLEQLINFEQARPGPLEAATWVDLIEELVHASTSREAARIEGWAKEAQAANGAERAAAESK